MQPTEWESIFADMSDKLLISKIYKELKKLNTKKQTTQLKSGQWTRIDIFKEYIQMANRHMKRCLTSLIIREMQIKATMKYHLMLVRLAIANKSTNRCWHGCGKKGILVRCCWECRLVQSLWKAVWRYLKKLKWICLLTQRPHIRGYKVCPEKV